MQPNLLEKSDLTSLRGEDFSGIGQFAWRDLNFKAYKARIAAKAARDGIRISSEWLRLARELR